MIPGCMILTMPYRRKPRASGDDPNIEANTYAIWE